MPEILNKPILESFYIVSTDFWEILPLNASRRPAPRRALMLICICVTGLIYMCAMTHGYVWRYWFMCVTWMIYTRDATCVSHVYVWCDAWRPPVLRCALMLIYIRVAWFIYMYDVTNSHVWRDWFTCITWLMQMHDVSRVYVRRHSFTIVHTYMYMYTYTYTCIYMYIYINRVVYTYVYLYICTYI